MAVTDTLNETISKNSAQVSILVDEMVNLLFANTTRVKLPKQMVDYFRNKIQDAFITIETKKENKTTYAYNFLFAIKNEYTGSIMLGLPVCLNITLKDKQSYNVNVKAIWVAKLISTPILTPTPIPILTPIPTSTPLILYRSMMDIDQEDQHAALDISRTFEKAVNPQTICFDLEKAIDLTKKNNSLQITAIIDKTINRKPDTTTIINSLVKILSDIGVSLSLHIPNYWTTEIEGIIKSGQGESYRVLFTKRTEVGKFKGLAIGLSIKVKDKSSCDVNVKILQVE